MKTDASAARKLHIVLILAALLILPGAGFAEQPAVPEGQIGILENLGGKVPQDAVFADESGAPVRLGSLIATPTILALVYYTCPNVCDYLLLGVAGALKSLDAVPGTDYRVITISIDERETAADARKAKRIALETVERPFPPGDWRFLTGSRDSIKAVSDAVGYHFVRRAEGIDHPVGIVILSPSGTVIRYMNGAVFLPADLKLSLLEASQGRVGPTIARVLRYCFSTDPKSHGLVFNLLKVVATVTLTLTAGFVAYLIAAGLRRRNGARRA
ncbi:MAG TPA: SCO family protein [Spirochaetia bacterium]|nr:SCO family protein [Spirochaetia bacterium]